MLYTAADCDKCDGRGTAIVTSIEEERDLTGIDPITGKSLLPLKAEQREQDRTAASKAKRQIMLMEMVAIVLGVVAFCGPLIALFAGWTDWCSAIEIWFGLLASACALAAWAGRRRRGEP